MLFDLYLILVRTPELTSNLRGTDTNVAAHLARTDVEIAKVTEMLAGQWLIAL